MRFSEFVCPEEYAAGGFFLSKTDPREGLLGRNWFKSCHSDQKKQNRPCVCSAFSYLNFTTPNFANAARICSFCAPLIKNFTRAILYGDELISPGEEGLAELSLCNAAYLSPWTNSPVLLPLDHDKYIEMLNNKRAVYQQKKIHPEHENSTKEYNLRWNTNW